MKFIKTAPAPHVIHVEARKIKNKNPKPQIISIKKYK